MSFEANSWGGRAGPRSFFSSFLAQDPLLGFLTIIRGIRERRVGAVAIFPSRVESVPMAFKNACIPYGSAWSTPFSKWQGKLANLHPLKLGAETGRKALERAGIDPAELDGLVLGWTVPSPSSFYGGPWVAGLLGAPQATGPIISQACATSARCLVTAARAVEHNDQGAVLVLAADRCSNGPHLYYPDPSGPGGKGSSEDWVWDNFSNDPWAKNSMLQTAENVAAKAGIDRAAQDELTLIRAAQYQDGLKDERSFQKRYMIPVELRRGRKVLGALEEDEGVFPVSAEGLAKLRPVMPEGTVTFGGQTHPADGNAGLVVTTEAQARAWSKDPAVVIRLRSYAEARVEKGYMAMAVVPAAQRALDLAGFDAKEVTIKTHNPFAVNDVYMAREMGLDPASFNNYGSSLIYGHPQGPTGLRLVAELIEELVEKGGGRGLFAGCAAGDSAAAICLEVDAG